MNDLVFRVAGVTFADGYPDNLHRLPWAHAHTSGEPLKALLIPNPGNDYDPEAVEVHIPSAGIVGHVPRCPIKAELFAGLASGAYLPDAEVEFVAVAEGHPDRPGLQIRYRWPEQSAGPESNQPNTTVSPAAPASTGGPRILPDHNLNR